MRNFILDTIQILPEILLVIGAISILIIGAFTSKRSLSTLALISVIFVSLTVFLVLQQKSTHAFMGMISVNAFTAFSKLLILIATLFSIVIYAAHARKNSYISYETFVLVLLACSGMMIAISANHLLILYLGIELMSLPAYVLASSNKRYMPSAEAGIKYFATGALSSGILLFGISLVYGFTISLDYVTINNYFINQVIENDFSSLPLAFLVGLIFIIAALAFKMSAAPFHMWSPDVYQGVAISTTAFFSMAPKVTAALLFTRLFFTAFNNYIFSWNQIIVVLAVLSMVIGSFGAIMQKGLKRMMAYSSIAHVGFILLGLISADLNGVRGMIAYTAIYLIMTAGVMACLIMTCHQDDADNISQLSGLYKEYPLIAVALALLMFSMAGIPPFAGFWAKFYVLYPIIETKLYWLAIVAVIASVVSAFFYIRIIKVMYFDRQNAKRFQYFPSVSLATIAVICVVFNAFYVLSPSQLLAMATVAASHLIGG
jgi:NADH-quinone oxidoreductase subunit N